MQNIRASLSHSQDLDIFLDTNVNIKALVGLLGKSAVSALVTALVGLMLLFCLNNLNDERSIPHPMPHNVRFPRTHITPVTTLIHAITSVILPTFVSVTHVFVHLRTLLVMAAVIFFQRSVLHFLTHISSFLFSFSTFNALPPIFNPPSEPFKLILLLQGCGSAVPRLFKARNGPITTVTQAKATCKPHETVCGIPGREGTLDFECIDIDTANDSCMYSLNSSSSF